MPRSLADGHTKVTILTSEPADPAHPTATELNAGLDASDNILASDFTFGATDSDKVQEKSLAAANNAQALGPGNYQCAFTLFRYFNASTGAVDPTEDAVFSACKVKGTELWVYARKNGKSASVAWASADEAFLGVHTLVDDPQQPDITGYIKVRIPTEVQDAFPYIAAA